MTGLLALIEDGLRIGSPVAVVEAVEHATELAARIFDEDEEARDEFSDPGKLASYLRKIAEPMLRDAQAALAGGPAPLGEPVIQKQSRKWIGLMSKPSERSRSAPATARRDDVKLSAATATATSTGAAWGSIDDLAATLGVSAAMLRHPTARLVLGEFLIRPSRLDGRELWPVGAARGNARTIARRIIEAVSRSAEFGCLAVSHSR